MSAEDLIAEGLEAAETGDLNRALNRFSTAVRIESKAEIWLHLADTYERLGSGNAYIIYLSKALSVQGDPNPELKIKLSDCLNSFVAANPNVAQVQQLYVKNPKAPRIEAERREFFKLIDQKKSKAAFDLGHRQYTQRRVDPLIQSVWCSLAARHGHIQMGLNSAFAAFVNEPHNWITLTNIADILCVLRKNLPALDFALAAVNMQPQLPVAWLNLSAAFENLGRHWEAAKACREAIRLDPKNSLAWTNLGNSLKNSGRSREATEAFRESVNLNPEHVSLWSNLLFGILYDETSTQDDIARETFRFGEYWEPRIKPIAHRDRLKAGVPPRLRVGFVSADIRAHPVAYFFEPLLQNLNRDKVEIYIYDNYLTGDQVTDRFKLYADKWLNVAELSDPDFVKRILRDKIDILVDMSGHTGRNRLKAFAQKPAPVQLTWLGHPATTGLTRMDWRITDHISDPDGEDRFYTEKLYRFQCAVCYAPGVKNPELRSDPKYHVNPTPALLNEFITFGSCNNLAKINQNVVDVWSRILNGLPNSKLLLESPGLSQQEFQNKVITDFSSYGIGAERLLLFTRDSALQYLRYHQIDIALDPFPYGGGTTSCDLLWMGVPLVTLKSPKVMGRAGASLLTHLGREEWIAESAEQYVSIATNLAADVSALNATRRALRGQFENSPLMNGPLFAATFEEAFFKMYSEAVSNA